MCRVEAYLEEWWEVGLFSSILLLLALSLPHTALAQKAIINIDGNWRCVQFISWAHVFFPEFCVND